ncbi:MAG TPA: VWA domain-containing protein [Thermoanaerobaculia bacterium]|nr:VWA domain-containing protein [Thermoanaerobaculia bacterium]
MKRFAITLLALAFAIPALAQEQPPPPSFGEQIDVNAVLLDVVVTDSRGNHILGLTKDDFIVKENGVEQPVDSADYFTNRKLLTAPESAAPFQVERALENRYFIFFIDKPEAGALQSELAQARQAMRDFIRKNMKERDLVAIAGHDVRLKIYSDFTSDKKQLERALTTALQFGPGITTAPAGDTPSILRNADTKEMIDHTGTVYEALDFLADRVKSIHARKNLVLFSPGIADRYETIRDNMITNRSPKLDPMLESLNAANVSVYAIQLQRDLGVDAASVFHQRLEEISQSTGGRYFRFNTSFQPALERVENTNSGYYLVTYRARHTKGTKGYQPVTVSVKNPEFRVVARSGYQFGS